MKDIIFKYRLDFDLGFGYCIASNKLEKDEFHGYLIRVLNYRDNGEKNELSNLLSSPYLLNVIGIDRKPKERGKGAWKKVAEIDPIDFPDPLFKYSNTILIENTDEKLVKNWQVASLEDKVQVDNKIYEYAQIAHLESKVISTPNTIVRRTTMEFLKREGKNIEDHYDVSLNSPRLSYRWDYIRAINMPFFDKIPSNFASQPVPKDKISEITWL